MVLFIPKKAICACALAAALVTLAAVVPRPSPDTVPASTAAEPRTMLVLDAGHGGEDGGAVSDSGVAESGINLQITRRLYEILRFLGHPAVMTRTGDEAIYDDAAATLREKKVSDLKNRTKLAVCSSASTRTACPATPTSAALRCFTTPSYLPNSWPRRCSRR